MVSVSLQISRQKDPTWPNRSKPHPHHQLPNPTRCRCHHNLKTQITLSGDPQVRLALYITHAGVAFAIFILYFVYLNIGFSAALLSESKLIACSPRASIPASTTGLYGQRTPRLSGTTTEAARPMLSALVTETDHPRLLTMMIFRFVRDGGSLHCVRWFAVAEASVASCECQLHYDFFLFLFFSL